MADGVRDVQQRLGEPLVVFSFGRSGTHMLIDLVRRQFPAFRAWKWPVQPNARVYGWLDALAEADDRGAVRLARCLARSPRPLLLTHRFPEMERQLAARRPEWGAWLTRGRVVHIVRNPRDAMNSAWPVECARADRGLQPRMEPLDYVRWSARRWVAQLDQMAHRAHLRMRHEDVRAEPTGAIVALARLTGERPRWREPLLSSPHASVAEARLCRLVSIQPWSTNCITPARTLQRHPLLWTPAMEAALDLIAGQRMAELGYGPVSERKPGAAPDRRTVVSALALSST